MSAINLVTLSKRGSSCFFLSLWYVDTSRAKGESEIDGQDYNFVSRAQFEEYASSPAGCRFVEHGEYDKQYYGTSLDAVRTVINSGKICVLNLQPSSLKILHESDLKPYVVFLTPPTLQTYRQQKAKYGEQYKVPLWKVSRWWHICPLYLSFSLLPFQEEEFRDSVSIAQEMEDNYGEPFYNGNFQPVAINTCIDCFNPYRSLLWLCHPVRWRGLRLSAADVRDQLAWARAPMGARQVGRPICQ